MNPFEDTPFAATPDAESPGFLEPMLEVEERLSLLRSVGRLTEATLRDYYGETRFDQVAESNALEGSPLDVGETKLAVLKGVTSLAYDLRYVRDAKALHEALLELEQLAQVKKTVDITEAHRLHEIVLRGWPGAGTFRNERVTITGSQHRPPRTRKDVMDAMEPWELWSIQHPTAPALLRATVLHAWFVYVHPYVDGNGRTARALSTLELIRGGHPPLILRKTRDRERYNDALEKADFGDIRPFADLMVDRATDAVRDLERAATRRQGFSSLVQKERRAYQNRLGMWNIAVTFLFEALQVALRDRLDQSDVALNCRRYPDLSLDDFIDLSKHERVSTSWAFSIRCMRPNGQRVEYLAWAAEPGESLVASLGNDANRPALRWSLPASQGLRTWRQARAEDSPYAIRMTFHRDRWLSVCQDGVHNDPPMELAGLIADAIVERLVPSEIL